MAENDTDAILSAIGALGEQLVGIKTDIAELKKTDKDLATEVHRLGEEQRKQGRELQELRAETLRTFESERHASAQTVQAITKHVDEAAQAFHAKAADIDEVKAETKKQSEELAKQTQILTRLDAVAAHPLARKVAYAVGIAILAWLGSKGIR
jgi:DNA repair exonuclease SbcCD ATPase subunit